MNRRLLIGITAVFVNLLSVSPLSAAMSGGSYNIPIDGLTMGEADAAVGGDYVLRETVGDFSGQTVTDSSYRLIGGFTGATGEGVRMTLSKSSISLSLGGSPLTTVASDSLALTVTTDSITGYASSISESGNLASGSNDINDAGDGSVTAGSEEYGITTSGTDAQLASDTAISGSVSVASSNIPVSDRATTVTFRAAVAQSTKSGNYSHTVTFTVTANP